MKSHFLTAIYDTKSGIYFAPNVARSQGEFIRSIQVEAKNTKSMLHQFPSDYELYVMGEWSEEDGILSAEKKRLGSVLDLCPLT